MNTAELRDKNVSELNEVLIELRKEQFSLRMQRGLGQLAKPHLFSAVQKNIARVKTIISQKSADLVS